MTDENANFSDDDLSSGDDTQTWSAAMYAVEIGRNLESNEPYAIIKGVMMPDFDFDEAGERMPESGAPVVETLLQRDEHTGLWQTVQSRHQDEAGEWVYLNVHGISMDPFDVVKMLLEEEEDQGVA